jgi:ABC-type glycerol-3-phosphate transport system substrate-binding protein
MKKIISMLLVLVMMLGLAACGGAKTPETTAVPTTAPAVSENPTEAPAAEVDTCILMETDSDMLNTYSVIAVNPQAPFADADGNAVADVYVNTAGADALVKWQLSAEALAAMAECYELVKNGTIVPASNFNGHTPTNFPGL